MDAQRTQLPDGRWHFQHGPMDVVLDAQGSASVVAQAHVQAWQRFCRILQELVSELPLLRTPVGAACPLLGPIAQRMWQACQPYRDTFITPMAAVAGAVAQELIACYAREGISRAWVNNGGDIALHLAPHESLRIGIFADLARLNLEQLLGGLRTDGQFEISHALPVRGVATSGWRGRSFSLGIADSVTVLARTAVQADAAATVIANAVNLDDARIVRRAACELKDDTDLGSLLVTVEVPPLEPQCVQRALQNGKRCAQRLQASGLIWSAALICQNQTLTTDTASPSSLPRRPARTPVETVLI